MDELISRQAAIDALNKMKIYRPLDSDRYVISDCLNKIVNLPSAQPYTEAEIQKMQDLEQAELEKAFELGKAEANRWIPCSERLPEDDDWQIVTILDEHGDTPYRYSDFGWYLDKAECWIIDAEQRTDVIAWCELPEPYKERREE